MKFTNYITDSLKQDVAYLLKQIWSSKNNQKRYAQI